MVIFSVLSCDSRCPAALHVFTWAPSHVRFQDHTQGRATDGMVPLG
jgi:hypothetical protein